MKFRHQLNDENRGIARSTRHLFAQTTLVVGLLFSSGCGSTETVIAGGVVAATAVGSQVPRQELRQVYYIGVFDPQDQLPPAIYRISVHGQSSMFSQMKFASGWVPAPLLDSLGSKISFSPRSSGGLGDLSIEGEDTTSIKAHRKLMMFGPEGFLEAPDDHRLVIVMGQSPDAWFNAIDSALGQVASAGAEQQSSKTLTALLTDLNKIGASQLELERINGAFLQ